MNAPANNFIDLKLSHSQLNLKSQILLTVNLHTSCSDVFFLKHVNCCAFSHLCLCVVLMSKYWPWFQACCLICEQTSWKGHPPTPAALGLWRDIELQNQVTNQKHPTLLMDNQCSLKKHLVYTFNPTLCYFKHFEGDLYDWIFKDFLFLLNKYQETSNELHIFTPKSTEKNNNDIIYMTID